MYKGVGWVVGKGWQLEAGYNSLLGLFGVAVSPQSVSHRPTRKNRWPKRRLTTTGVNFRPIPPMQYP